jgi:hypothetical protein
LAVSLSTVWSITTTRAGCCWQRTIIGGVIGGIIGGIGGEWIGNAVGKPPDCP